MNRNIGIFCANPLSGYCFSDRGFIMSNYFQALTGIVGSGSIGVGEGSASGLGDLLGKSGFKSGGKSFEAELMLAEKVLGTGSAQGADRFSSGMDSSIMSDALMVEALEALSQVRGLTRSRQMMPYGANSISPENNMDRLQKGESSQFDIKSGVTGELSSRFESGSKGVAAIGYDRVGGTSYGKYQIASKTGTMDEFLGFLKGKVPEWADRLTSSGPANTGGTGGAMPDEWKKIASEDPEGFEAVQHDFIKASHYDPAARMVLDQTGIDMNRMPAPIREMLWSTSVQHGATGAGRMIADAVEKLSAGAREQGFPSDLVREIYGARKEQFGSSTESVRSSVQNRLQHEENIVLSMLEKKPFSKVV